jgi:thiaminase/transcriptional activator TenA
MITLHDNPNFRGFVDFLRAELDRVGHAQANLCRVFFGRAVALELAFFEAAYAERARRFRARDGFGPAEWLS